MDKDFIKWKIKELKRKLEESDYKAIKYAEGLITAEDYEETKVERQSWRDEINYLEQQLADLIAYETQQQQELENELEEGEEE